jgi:DNA-binding CsgD family transcriptional regulator
MSVDEQVEPRRARPPGPEFAPLGRETERAAIDRVLDAVRDGLSAILVLRGEPGVGKTTLLRYAIDAAPDLRVASVAGVESEFSMEFGGLHQILLPFLPLLGDLPPPQRGALRVAFGQQTGAPPERFLVALAALTLLSRAAQDQPLLCTVDDAHWLDPESAHVLGFVARRLCADRAGIIATSNSLVPSLTAEGLPTITLSGLPDAAARDLLAAVSGGALSAQVVDRILTETRNNPLALVELGTGYPADQLSARAALPEPLPLGQRLRAHFLGQVGRLAPDAQVFALLAAAEPGGQRGRLWRAALRAGIDPERAAAETGWAGVLQFPGDSVRFPYPLMRSAVYHGANAADRRRAHRILAEAGEPELRPWHLAAAAIVPDEELAAELQRTAERAAARGGYAARAALLRRSADLTPDGGRRAEREVALAQAKLVGGDPAGAQTVLDAAQPRLATAAARGQARQLAGAIRFAQGDAAAAARILASAAQASAHDDRLARDAMFGALEAAMWCGPELTKEIACLARAFPPIPGVAPSATDLLLEGYSARFTLGYQASVRPLRAAVSALLADDLDPAVGLRCFAHGAVAAGSLWDDRATFDLLDRWVAAARATGAFTTLPVALSYHATSQAAAGRLREADASWAAMLEVLTLSHGLGALGRGSRRNGVALAYRGSLAEARAMGLDLGGESAGGGQGRVADVGGYIAALADSFDGDYPAAVSRGLAVLENGHAYTVERILPELVEAAFRAGQPEVAAAACETLSQRALAAGTPWGLGLRARCAALLTDGAAAEDSYREAISQLERCQMAADLARAHLLYGQWLRRGKRRRGARAELRTAHEMFAAMGARRFADLAAAELSAAGEHPRARTPETLATLTPQESRIADLTAAGASNSEIAAQLFISPSTVDYHLRKVFRKLNVTSRTQLASRLKSG